MSNRNLGSGLLATLGAALLVGGTGMATMAEAQAEVTQGKARGQLYSTAAVNRFCKEAQQIIANTLLVSNNVVWDELGLTTPPTGFVASDALPYDGATDLPLTTQQYVGYGSDAKGKEYPQVVMCKMKSWDALEHYYPGSASAGSSCATVNEATGEAVIASLTNDNREPQTVTDIVYDNWRTYSGAQWTDGAPAPVAYMSSVDGKLHVVGKGLYVERTNPSPFAGPPKKGVDYCQVIAPEYLREIIVGNITPPTCDAPPVYAPGPPQPPVAWNCSNP